MPIFGFTGFAGSGKSTACQILKEDYGFAVLSFADGLREMAMDIDPQVSSVPMGPGYAPLPIHYSDAMEMYGYEKAKEKLPEFRRFLQRLGTDGIRKHIGSHTWVEMAEARIESLWTCFDDLRFPNEAEMINSRGGHVVRIYKQREQPLHKEHSSESSMLDVEADFDISNDSSSYALKEALHELLSRTGVHI